MNKEQFLSMGVKPVKINVESLQKEITVKELSYKGAIELAKAIDPVDRAVLTLINSVCNEDGSLIFSNEDKELVSETFTFATIQEIAVAISKLTNIKPSDTVK